MGRSSKDKNEAEHLRGVLRQQKAEIKHLKKQLARSNKQATQAVNELSGLISTEPEWPNPVDQLDATPSAEPLNAPKSNSNCIKCGKRVNIIDLSIRTVYACSNEDCKHRRTVKK